MTALVRRSLALALAAGAALLLLLLARLPPAPAPRARPHAAPAPPPPPPPAHTAPDRAPSSQSPSAPPVNVTSPPRAAPPPAPPAHRAPPAGAKNKTAEKVIYTKDMYEGGHMWPHPERCPALGAGVRLLILVTSAPAHAPARDAVRLTWGHYAARADVAMAFVLGRPPDALLDALEKEDALYGDLIVGNSVDSYSNLTLKTLSMLEWADSYCPRARRLLKTDDDMFINVPRLLQFIDAPGRVNATRTIYGKVLKKGVPIRLPKSKYFLPRTQYPGAVLPPFTTGPAYVLTADCIRPLLEAGVGGARAYVRLEDVFVTGVLAGALGIARRHAPEFYNKKISAHPCTVARGISIHMVRYHEQFDLWKKSLDKTAKCS